MVKMKKQILDLHRRQTKKHFSKRFLPMKRKFDEFESVDPSIRHSFEEMSAPDAPGKGTGHPYVFRDFARHLPTVAPVQHPMPKAGQKSTAVGESQSHQRLMSDKKNQKDPTTRIWYKEVDRSSEYIRYQAVDCRNNPISVANWAFLMTEKNSVGRLTRSNLIGRIKVRVYRPYS